MTTDPELSLAHQDLDDRLERVMRARKGVWTVCGSAALGFVLLEAAFPGGYIWTLQVWMAAAVLIVLGTERWARQTRREVQDERSALEGRRRLDS